MATISLLQAMRNVNKDADASTPSIQELTHVLNLPYVGWHHDFPDYEERLVAYPLVSWLCTDTQVGLEVIYFDGEPVALRKQVARKADYEYRFVDHESMTRLRTYLTHIEEPDVEFIDADEQINTDYAVRYANQIMSRTGYYMGRPVTLVASPGYHGYAHETVAVRDAEGNEFLIPVADYRMMIDQAQALLPEPDAPFGLDSTAGREAVLQMVREAATAWRQSNPPART